MLYLALLSLHRRSNAQKVSVLVVEEPIYTVWTQCVSSFLLIYPLGCTWKGRDVAFKCFRIDNDRDMEVFQREAKVFSSLKHQHILAFLGFVVGFMLFTFFLPVDVVYVHHALAVCFICLFSGFYRYLIVLMEYCAYGDLANFVKKHGEKLPQSERIRLLYETAQALRYLHNKKPPILHR